MISMESFIEFADTKVDIRKAIQEAYPDFTNTEVDEVIFRIYDAIKNSKEEAGRKDLQWTEEERDKWISGEYSFTYGNTSAWNAQRTGEPYTLTDDSPLEEQYGYFSRNGILTDDAILSQLNWAGDGVQGNDRWRNFQYDPIFNSADADWPEFTKYNGDIVERKNRNKVRRATIEWESWYRRYLLSCDSNNTRRFIYGCLMTDYYLCTPSTSSAALLKNLRKVDENKNKVHGVKSIEIIQDAMTMLIFEQVHILGLNKPLYVANDSSVYNAMGKSIARLIKRGIITEDNFPIWPKVMYLAHTSPTSQGYFKKHFEEQMQEVNKEFLRRKQVLGLPL